ncbi:hypothetical protein AeRB84_007995 [Aphanomyces euteiches]|nr:hypothetical protein AeRB84_007995 [Aphanomyces euteiches]
MLHDKVWELVPLAADRKALKCKWVWKVKYDADGSLERFKARLCLKGYLQIAGVDYTDTYAPVLRLDSLRLLCALVATLDLETAQLDVKATFLNGDLDEDIYMEQPERYQVEGKTHLMCKLNKSIYGLKQAPRQWNKNLNDHLASISFKRCHKEQCINVMVNNENRTITYLAVYVDDIVIATSCKKALDAVTRTFHKISQSMFVEELLVKFHMQGCDSEPTPQVQGLPADVRANDNANNLPYRNLTGALQYLVTATRPDIAYAVRFLNRTITTTTQHLGIKYDGEPSARPKAFNDADFANDKQDSKSITGSVITMGGGAITYMSKKQSLVGQSTTKVEFIAAAETAKNLISLHELLHEMKVKINLPIDMFVDNQSAIQVAKGAATHSRTKHIRLRFLFLKELVEENVVCLQYTSTKDQIADIFTKSNLTLEIPHRFKTLRKPPPRHTEDLSGNHFEEGGEQGNQPHSEGGKDSGGGGEGNQPDSSHEGSDN